MRARTMIFLSLALVAAGSTFMLAQNWIQSQRDAFARLAQQQRAEEPKPQTAVYVLVAAQTLSAGDFVKKQHLKWQAWPEDGLSEAFVRKAGKGGEEKDQIEGYINSVVRSRLLAGEPITEGRLVRPDDRGFLAAVLKPGKRAISVPVNATTGIAGFVFPGDYVDLLLTHAIRENAASQASRRATETVLQNVRVLAIDQRTDDVNGKPTVAKTATLEVDPKEAEIIAVSSDIGRLSLSLRSLSPRMVNGKPVPDIRTHTWDTEASLLIPPPPSARKDLREVRVVRGGSTTVFAFAKNRVHSVTGEGTSGDKPAGDGAAGDGSANETAPAIAAGPGDVVGATGDGLGDAGNLFGKVY